MFPEIEIEEVFNFNFEKKTIIKITLWEKTTDAVVEAISVLKNDPRVTFANPNYYGYTDSYTFTDIDPYYDYGLQWNMDAIDAPDAWEITTGNSQDPVSVGVLDTGIYGQYGVEHEDLEGNCDANQYGWDLVNVVSDAIDSYGHGTHVAGIIGANGDNGLGVAGVCWDVDIVPYRVVDGETTDDLTAQAINIAKTFHIPILNISLGTGNEWPCTEVAMAQFPGLIILSAGNEHYDLDNNGQHYPASYAHENVTIMNNKNVIVVGCLSEQGNWGNLEQYSLWDVNQFEGTNYGVDSVDLFAPGAEIISTYLNSTYAFNTGTSMAAPLVTGVAALVLSAHPAFSSAQLRSVIKWSVKTISGLEGFCNTGGMVNAKNALEVADLTLGDLNGDDDASNADIILLANYLANYITLSNYQKYCADLNFDGVINNADLILLAQMVVS